MLSFSPCCHKESGLKFMSTAAFSSYDGDLSLPLGLALGSPIFPLGCEGEGKLGVALEQMSSEKPFLVTHFSNTFTEALGKLFSAYSA